MILAGPYAGPEQLARFRLEAVAVAALQHPGIVQIYEIGSHAGHAYLALEYVVGGTLMQKCAGKPLSPTRAAEMVDALARAVHYAHQHGIIHRDLKPSNVLLTETGEPKITDFGLAKKHDAASPDLASLGRQPGEGLTASGAILGTPAYMAPEQAGGLRGGIGPGSDIYALGAMLYELLTGRPPFQAANPMDVILKVMTAEPVFPGRLEATVPRDLKSVCLKCLQKEPARRYKSAEALANDLRRFLLGEPTKARPATAGERFRRWAWQCRGWLAGGAAAAVLLLVLTVSLAMNALGLLFPSPQGVVSYGSAGVSDAGIAVKQEAPVALPEDLDLVPRDAVLFLTIRVADLLNRNDVQGLNQELIRAKLPSLDDAGAAIEQALGLRWGEIEHATLVNLQPGPPGRLVRHPAGDKASLFARTGTGPPGQSRAQGPATPGQDVLRPRSRRTGQRFPAQRSRPGLESTARVVERVVGPHSAARDRRAVAPGPGAGGARRHHLVAGAVPPPQTREDLVGYLEKACRQAPPAPGVGPPNLRPLAEVRAATMTADLSSRADGANSDSLRLDLRLGFADTDAGQHGHNSLMALWPFLRGFANLYSTGERTGLPPTIAQELTYALRTTVLQNLSGQGSLPRRGGDGTRPVLPREGNTVAEETVIMTMNWASTWPARRGRRRQGRGRPRSQSE